MATIIVKNITESDKMIEDLGISIPALDQVDLSELFRLYEICGSHNLKSLIENDYFIINDGTSDLNKECSLNCICVETHYQDETNVDAHNLDEHVDVPEKPTSGNKILEVVNGICQWSITPDLNSVGLRGITVNVVHPNQDYEEEESTSWVVLASFVFPGSDILNATLFEIVASRNGSTGLSACRLFDFTNNNEIAYIEWSSENKAKYSDNTLSNLPQSSAIFEVQVKRVTGSKTRFHASTLR